LYWLKRVQKIHTFQSTPKIEKKPTMDHSTTQAAPRRVKTRELKDSERIALVSMLLGLAHFGPLPVGAVAEVAKKFDVSRECTRRLWRQAKTSRATGILHEKEIVSKKNQRGAKKKWDEDEVKEIIKAIPAKKRRSYRALAGQLEIPLSSVWKMKKKVVVRHTNALKPRLTDDHKIARIEYALSMRNPQDKSKYQDMYDMVHIDEKWFFMTSDGECYLLAVDEEPPERLTAHKGYIGKVMFLCATARPRMIQGKMWDGKIGIWPIGHVDAAKRTSKNRKKGDPVWVNESVTREKYREMLIDNVLPAILAKFPTAYLERKCVRIQQDGAKSHIDHDDEEWLAALEELAPENNITLFTQCAQSPDCNINDLAFFRSIQSLYYEAAPDDELALIAAVKRAYEEYPASKINRMWITLQSCLNAILQSNGGNHYSIPHMNKEKLEREGKLPKVLAVCAAAATFDTFVPLPMAGEPDENNPAENNNDDTFP
jgi:transposase-like protein